VRQALATGDKQQALAAFQASQGVIDSMAGKGIIHKNAAARYKSRLMARIKALG